MWFFLFKKIVLVRGRHTERGGDAGRVGSGLPAGGPMRDSVPGPEVTLSAEGRRSTTEPARHSFLIFSDPSLHLYLWRNHL